MRLGVEGLLNQDFFKRRIELFKTVDVSVNQAGGAVEDLRGEYKEALSTTFELIEKVKQAYY